MQQSGRRVAQGQLGLEATFGKNGRLTDFEVIDTTSIVELG